jgi:hypothetical protein
MKNDTFYSLWYGIFSYLYMDLMEFEINTIQKNCVKQVPLMLTEEHKIKHVGGVLTFLRHRQEGDHFLGSDAQSYEMPNSKCQSLSWIIVIHCQKPTNSK